jgi:hypothetical protein
MIKIKSTKMAWLCIIPALLLPVLVQAESTGTGSIAATQAADQKAALAKKAAAREARKAAAEQLKGTQAPVSTTEEKPAVEPSKTEPAAQ